MTSPEEIIKKIDQIREELGEEQLKVLEKELELLQGINIQFAKHPKINKLFDQLKSDILLATKDMKEFVELIKKEIAVKEDLEREFDYEVIEEDILKDFTIQIKDSIKVLEKLDKESENVPLVENIVVNIAEHIEGLRILLEKSVDLLINELKFTEEELGISKEDVQQSRIRIFTNVFEKLKEPVKGEF